MKKIDIIEAKLSHIDDLHSKIKQTDIDECLASNGVEPHEALVISLTNSQLAYTVTVDEQPEMMFGVTDEGAIWMLSSEKVFEIITVKRFIKETKRFVREFHQHHEVLWNWVDERNLKSLMWLRRVGFKMVDREEAFGFAGIPFIQIISVRN